MEHGTSGTRLKLSPCLAVKVESVEGSISGAAPRVPRHDLQSPIWKYFTEGLKRFVRPRLGRRQLHRRLYAVQTVVVGHVMRVATKLTAGKENGNPEHFVQQGFAF